ncbi:MAG: ROK family protein [Spartobacteria bacterium]|nr:ROK family protein [Spartobacteria bacterium]
MRRTTKKNWVGFDLGGTKMQACVYNDTFTCLGRKRKKTLGHEGSEAGLARIVETINKALNEANVAAASLGGIGVGCPGPLDLNKGIMIDTPNLGWKNVKLKEFLEKEFQCPAIIANDVDAGVYGEYRRGAAVGARCVLGVFPGTGIGGGCVYEGKLIRGKKGSCMELGHLQVLPEGPLCGCGQHGCLEAVASRLAISSAAAVAAYRGDAPALLELAGMDLSNIRSAALRKSIEAGDHVIEQIIREAARWLGVGIANIINLLSPDVVVLGGGLVEALPHLFLEVVTETARAHVMPAYVKSFQVLISKLGDDATTVGSACLARDAVLEE